MLRGPKRRSAALARRPRKTAPPHHDPRSAAPARRPRKPAPPHHDPRSAAPARRPRKTAPPHHDLRSAAPAHSPGKPAHPVRQRTRAPRSTHRELVRRSGSGRRFLATNGHTFGGAVGASAERRFGNRAGLKRSQEGGAPDDESDRHSAGNAWCGRRNRAWRRPRCPDGAPDLLRAGTRLMCSGHGSAGTARGRAGLREHATNCVGKDVAQHFKSTSRGSPAARRFSSRRTHRAAGPSRQVRTRPAFSSPLRSSSPRCCNTVGSDASSGGASSLTQAPPRVVARRSRGVWCRPKRATPDRLDNRPVGAPRRVRTS